MCLVKFSGGSAPLGNLLWGQLPPALPSYTYGMACFGHYANARPLHYALLLQGQIQDSSKEGAKEDTRAKHARIFWDTPTIC